MSKKISWKRKFHSILEIKERFYCWWSCWRTKGCWRKERHRFGWIRISNVFVKQINWEENSWAMDVDLMKIESIELILSFTNKRMRNERCHWITCRIRFIFVDLFSTKFYIFRNLFLVEPWTHIWAVKSSFFVLFVMMKMSSGASLDHSETNLIKLKSMLKIFVHSSMFPFDNDDKNEFMWLVERKKNPQKLFLNWTKKTKTFLF